MVRAPIAGEADLAAVGVAGEDGVVPVGGELVQHPEVRRVRDAEPHVGVAVGRPGHGREVVVPEVRVVDAGEGEVVLADGERSALVGEVEPAARRRSRRRSSRHGSCGAWVLRLPLSGSR